MSRFNEYLDAMTKHIAAVQRANEAMARAVPSAELIDALRALMVYALDEDEQQEMLLIAQVT